MKRTRKIIALLAIGVLMSTAALAQKIGHIGLDSLIKWMPESKKAEAILTEHGKGLEKEIISMQQELQKKFEDYEKVKTAPDIVRTKVEDEIRNLQQRIEMFRQQAEQDYQQKTVEISKPIYDKAKKGIEAVAKENGYKYILDTSTGMILYSEASDDVLALVKKKLSAMPEAVLPGAPAAATTPKTNPAPPKPAGK